MDYEIDSMDGAYKGRLHVAWPFIVVERHRPSDKRSTMMFMVSIGHVLSNCLHACALGHRKKHMEGIRYEVA